jgi:hypothetical protein
MYNSYIIMLKISVGGYISPWGWVAELCEIVTSDPTHREIVDIAMLASSNSKF